MNTISFERFAGVCAVVVGLSGLAYAIAFVTLLSDATKTADALSNALLMFAGLLSIAVLVAVYGRLRQTDEGFALLALILGVTGAAGSIAHGGHELAKIVNTPPFDPGLPNATDPRGLFTFGLTALAGFVVAGLILRGAALPRGVAYVGIASGLLLLVVYFGRLIVLDPKEPWLLASAVAVGFVLNPIWYVWVGLTFWRGERLPRYASAGPAAT
jgi:hypothetical protein